MLLAALLQVLLVLGDLVVDVGLMRPEVSQGLGEPLYLAFLLLTDDSPVRDFLKYYISKILNENKI